MRSSERVGFVQRGSELAVLESALANAHAGSPSLVLVSGDAGVGKSRLLQEFVSNFEGLSVWGSCLPMGDRGLPFAPIVEALRALRIDPALVEEIDSTLQPLLSPSRSDVEVGPAGGPRL